MAGITPYLLVGGLNTDHLVDMSFGENRLFCYNLNTFMIADNNVQCAGHVVPWNEVSVAWACGLYGGIVGHNMRLDAREKYRKRANIWHTKCYEPVLRCMDGVSIDTTPATIIVSFNQTVKEFKKIPDRDMYELISAYLLPCMVSAREFAAVSLEYTRIEVSNKFVGKKMRKCDVCHHNKSRILFEECLHFTCGGCVDKLCRNEPAICAKCQHQSGWLAL